MQIFPIGRNVETKLPKKRSEICCQRLQSPNYGSFRSTQ